MGLATSSGNCMMTWVKIAEYKQNVTTLRGKNATESKTFSESGTTYICEIESDGFLARVQLNMAILGNSILSRLRSATDGTWAFEFAPTPFT